jgi:hypothetical protein
VGGDHHPGKVQAVKQRLELRALVAGGVDLALGQHRGVGVVHDGQQLHRPGMAAADRAAQRLAVNGERPSAPRARRAQPRSQPRAERPVDEPVGVHARKDPADGGLAGTCQRRVRGSRRTPSAARTGPGASAAPRRSRATLRAPASTAAALRASTLARGWRRPRRARVREYGQPFQQAGALAHGERAGMVGVGDSGGDGG